MPRRRITRKMARLVAQASVERQFRKYLPPKQAEEFIVKLRGEEFRDWDKKLRPQRRR